MGAFNKESFVIAILCLYWGIIIMKMLILKTPPPEHTLCTLWKIVENYG